MVISFQASSLRQATMAEYAARFGFGGAVTVMAGWLAERFGPWLGGLFLAFPAIFPATVTLLEARERKKKRAAGIPKTSRGREAAALEARGAGWGAAGMVAFAMVLWWRLPQTASVAATLAAMMEALAAWAAVGAALWLAHRRGRGRREAQ